MTDTRSIAELIDPTNSGQQLVDSWISAAANPVEKLPCTVAAGERCLTTLQVTTRSPLGAIAYHTGGLLVDHGWIRVLGAGGDRLGRSVADWNGFGAEQHRLPNALLIADDVLGGFFAQNGGRFDGQLGSVNYFAPDTLRWEDLECSYSDWMQWLFNGNLEQFYSQGRWPNWREDAVALHGDRGILVYPFPSCEGPPFAERTRGDVPLEELWRMWIP
jgi:hypothetical protein